MKGRYKSVYFLGHGDIAPFQNEVYDFCRAEFYRKASIWVSQVREM